MVEQAFCSSWGDDALDLLGDLAFQDGRFGEALSMYRQLVPDRPEDPFGLVHPDPSVDLARVAAKKLLCRAALGERPADPAEIEAFATAYPERRRLAGRPQGPAARQILAEALARRPPRPRPQPDGRWPTFAGSPTRTKIVPGAIDVGSLQWRVELDPSRTRGPARQHRGGMRRGGRPSDGHRSAMPDRLLAYHPIVLGDQVIVCDDTQIARTT